MRSTRITSETVRDDFNSIEAVIHYTRAAHSLGLWESERILFERFLPDRRAAILEAGCGAGRVTLGLWELGYRNLTAFDFAGELLEQAVSLATERGASAIRFLHADATSPELCQLIADKPPTPSSEARDRVCHLLDDKLSGNRGSDARSVCHLIGDKQSGMTPGEARSACNLIGDKRPDASSERAGGCFDAVLFLFNGLMQIPGRENRRAAMRNLHRTCRPGAPFLFTTHDRDDSATERKLWAAERDAWKQGRQDPRLVDFGDRYMESVDGRIFMHLPDQAEIREDLDVTGWEIELTAMRRDIARESREVRAFSDECRFWVARRCNAPSLDSGQG